MLYLLGVVCVVLAYSRLPGYMRGEAKAAIQVGIMLLMTLLSLAYTPKANRKENNFNWNPIKEVGILFACEGFATMISALKILEIRGTELGISHPWQFFWMSGGLSSFLDNAPTYLTFLSLGKSVTASMVSSSAHALSVIGLNDGSMVSTAILKAISLGFRFHGS